ncbi:2991_t:CDS:2, partial [Rhizophagus irregularis]
SLGFSDPIVASDDETRKKWFYRELFYLLFHWALYKLAIRNNWKAVPWYLRSPIYELYHQYISNPEWFELQSDLFMKYKMLSQNQKFNDYENNAMQDYTKKFT